MLEMSAAVNNPMADDFQRATQRRRPVECAEQMIDRILVAAYGSKRLEADSALSPGSQVSFADPDGPPRSDTCPRTRATVGAKPPADDAAAARAASTATTANLTLDDPQLRTRIESSAPIATSRRSVPFPRRPRASPG